MYSALWKLFFICSKTIKLKLFSVLSCYIRLSSIVLFLKKVFWHLILAIGYLMKKNLLKYALELEQWKLIIFEESITIMTNTFSHQCIYFVQGGIECRLRRAAIAGQQVFMEKIVKLVKMVARESGNRKRKVIILGDNVQCWPGISNFIHWRHGYIVVCIVEKNECSSI